MMLTRNGVSIGVGNFPDRKKPCLIVQEGNVGVIVASFSSKDNAEYFKQKVHQMLEGMIEDKRGGGTSGTERDT